MFARSSYDPSRTIILAGSGRSGTTWVGNIIAANPGFQVIFEPSDFRRVPEAACLPLFPYARLEGAYPHWEIFFRDVLSGRVRNSWTDREGKRWWARRFLIKEIRANLMLGWIDRTFHPKIVYMTRHPCAVVLSRMKLKWETHLDVFIDQKQLVADYLDPFMGIIRGARTDFQKQAVMWCVENLVPLRQLPNHPWVFCTYEHLYCSPEVETRRILAELGLRHTWFTQRAIKRISVVTRPDSSVQSGQNPLVEWQNELSHADIADILAIIHAFGITLYGPGPMPDHSPLEAPSSHHLTASAKTFI